LSIHGNSFGAILRFCTGLNKETEAFLSGDLDAWKSYRCRTEEAYLAYGNQCGVFSAKGWAAIEARARHKAAVEGREKAGAKKP
jgi:hypothetical protein